MILFFRHLGLVAAATSQLAVAPAWATEALPPRSVTAVPAPAAAPTVVTTQPRPNPSCIPDWSEAGPIVRSEGLATIEKVGRLARDRASVEIVNSMLCKTEEQRYVYRLTVRGSQGALRVLIVDARQPFGQP